MRNFQRKFSRLAVVLVGCSLFVSLLMPFSSANARLIWADEFQEDLSDEWTILDGTFTTENHILEPSDPTFELEEHCIQRDSPVAYGSWSFDFYIRRYPGEKSHLVDSRFFFIADEMDDNPGSRLPENGYALRIFSDSGIGPVVHLFRYSSGRQFLVGGCTAALDGWNHIEITRNTTGCFELFINGSCWIEATDTTHETSTCFAWRPSLYQALDNVTVTAPDPINNNIIYLLIGTGVAVTIVVLVLTVWFVRRR